MSFLTQKISSKSENKFFQLGVNAPAPPLLLSKTFGNRDLPRQRRIRRERSTRTISSSFPRGRRTLQITVNHQIRLANNQLRTTPANALWNSTNELCPSTIKKGACKIQKSLSTVWLRDPSTDPLINREYRSRFRRILRAAKNRWQEVESAERETPEGTWPTEWRGVPVWPLTDNFANEWRTSEWLEDPWASALLPEDEGRGRRRAMAQPGAATRCNKPASHSKASREQIESFS